MSNSHGAVIFRHIRRLAAQAPCQQSDRQLLQQFIADRDENAFAKLVARHGTLVLGVCRSVLRQPQDAEDVFQAAFLVLARKAHTIRKQEALSSWLHGVAYRLAIRAATQGRRRRDRELEAAKPFSTSLIDDLTMRELRVILHEELHGLAEKYRAPLLLCYCDGKTRDEAAELLAMTPGAFKKRLEHARNLLRGRLIRRGLVPSSPFFATLFADTSLYAAAPGALANTTTAAAISFVTGKNVGVSATAVALAEGVIQTMNLTKWATTVLAILFLCGLGTGLTLGAYRLLQPGDPRDNAAVEQNAQAAQQGGKETTDKERILGIWRFSKGVANGEDLPPEFIVLSRLHFARDGELIMSLGEETKKSKYDLVGPGKIDLQMGAADEDKSLSLAIYKFDGNDRLTLCIGNNTRPRPTKFGAENGSGRAMFVLVRAKPGEEKPTAAEIAQFKGGVNKLREAANRAQSSNNLKQIAIAMHNYHDQGGSLPAHAIYSQDGKTPLLSWRVAILPYLEQGKLYEEFKLDEPWDSPHNQKLIPKMPRTYALAGATKAKAGETYYQVVTGPDTLFDGAKKTKFTDIKDGTSNTLLAVEAKTPVVWTRPEDLQLPKDKDMQLPVGGHFTDGFNMLLSDGSVRLLPQGIAAPMLRALITPAARD